MLWRETKTTETTEGNVTTTTTIERGLAVNLAFYGPLVALAVVAALLWRLM